MMLSGKNFLALAKAVQNSVKKLPGVYSPCQALDYDLVIKDPDLIKATRKRFLDGNYADAVLNGYKYVNNLVKKKSGLSTDGASLMKTALSANSPIIKLNDGVTQSEKDEQLGYMEICSGCMSGIRNPRAHEHDWQDSPEIALRLLIWADHLVMTIKKSKE